MTRPAATPRSGTWLAVAAVVVAAAAVVGALLVIGSPAAQREARLDQRRVEDLQRLADALERFARLKDGLPDALSRLDQQPGVALPLADPATGVAYEYRPTGARRYELCAVFLTDTALAPRARPTDAEWAHGAGRHCFDRLLPADPAPR